jgi:hypothetical protein
MWFDYHYHPGLKDGLDFPLLSLHRFSFTFSFLAWRGQPKQEGGQ